MIDHVLKNRIDTAYRLADTAGRALPDFNAQNNMSLRDMLKYNFLQYIGFLFETDGTDGRSELEFIKDYIGMTMDISQFMNFKYGKCMDKDFINTPPKALFYLAKYDMSVGIVKAQDGKNLSKTVVDLFKDLGTAFVAVNGETITEVANLSNYSLMLDNFLKEYGLYFGNPGSVANNRTGNTGDVAAKVEVSNTKAAAISSTESDQQEETLDQLMEELNSLVGLKSVKQDLTNLINLVKVRKLREERGMKQPDITLHLVFSGNPGTGKTTVARLLAKIYKALGVVSQGQLVEVDRSKLVAGYVGQTAAMTAEVVKSALGGILFIDEAYTLIKVGDEKDFGQEAVDTLLKLMEDNRDDLIVIVAGYTDKMEEFVNSNPGLKSRFNKYIFFSDYTGKELTDIFKSMCKKQEYVPDKEALEYVKEYLNKRAKAHEENFANAREVRNYIERCIERQASRIVDIDDISDEELRTLRIEDVTE